MKDLPKNKGRKKGSSPPWWLVVVAAVVLIFMIRSLASGPTVASDGTIHYPSQGHDHVPPPVWEHFHYNSDPPTSGPHEELSPNHYIRSGSPWPVALTVHMLEHGNVIINYNPKQVSLETVNKIVALSRQYDVGPVQEQVMAGPSMAGQAVLVQPYPAMPYNIAVTAWTRLLPLKSFNAVKINAFVHQWLSNGANTSQ